MSDLAEWIAAAIEQNPGWVGLIFALVAFGESVAFVGALIPATPILLLVGGLIASGRVDPWEVVPGAILGALAGYGLSYTAGRMLGRQLTRHHRLGARRRQLARARLFFRRWGAPSLIFGRYLLGPFQSLLPLVAGSMGMGRRRFWAINLVSSLLWIPVCLTPGYLAVAGGGRYGLSREWQDGAAVAISAVSFGGAAVFLLLLILGRPRSRGRRQA